MRKIIISTLIILAVLVVGILWWNNGLMAANFKDNTPHIFVVNQGEGVREISKNLKDEGLIRDQIVFFLYARMQGIDKNIQAGDFRLNPAMKMADIANNLTHGTLDIWVTIPEGQRALEIAQTLKAKIPSYKSSWDLVLAQNEGYLFPDTYLIPRDADINFILDLLKGNFEKKYSTLKITSNKLSKQEIITVASLIEREANNDKDRPLIASVILNRYEIGMKLDIDATLQYALGYQEDQNRWWKKGLTATDKLINSPYNTYRIAGLPPTPISNPGLASLEAVVSPASTNYLYYMTDKNGITHYAETISGHNANIQKYGL